MITFNHRKAEKISDTFPKKQINHLKNIQNYLPIYNEFFNLNETNYNSIQLNTHIYLKQITQRKSHSVFRAKLFNTLTNKIEEKDIYIKYSPILRCDGYLTGKYHKYTNYNATSQSILQTPAPFTETDSSPLHQIKTNMNNNEAYTSSFFCYLSSKLLHEYNFLNGLDCYGIYTCNQNDFRYDISDDLDELIDNSFFMKNKGTMFTVDEEFEKCIPKKHTIEIINDEDVDDETKSHDSDTSNSVNTEEGEQVQFESEEEDEDTENNSENQDEDPEGAECEENYGSTSECFSLNDEENIFAYVKGFPVSMTLQEKGYKCLDEYMMDEEDFMDQMEEQLGDNFTDEKFNELDAELKIKWKSIFAQIIFTLIGYNKAFNCVHNDLHAGNVVYIKTQEKYIYYKFENKYFKVPTFGKIWKIIDFDRATYYFKGKLICSGAFSRNENGFTQYNTEPYYNPKKRRVDYNPSFDLCRLACSIFDDFIDDEDTPFGDLDTSTFDDIEKIIYDWTMDDKGKNVMYKSNGLPRYDDFKLYKMIARKVHNCVPSEQIHKPLFNEYIMGDNKHIKQNMFVDIDKIPNLTVDF
jgi:hypothetical protein